MTNKGESLTNFKKASGEITKGIISGDSVQSYNISTVKGAFSVAFGGTVGQATVGISNLVNSGVSSLVNGIAEPLKGMFNELAVTASQSIIKSTANIGESLLLDTAGSIAANFTGFGLSTIPSSILNTASDWILSDVAEFTNNISLSLLHRFGITLKGYYNPSFSGIRSPNIGISGALTETQQITQKVFTQIAADTQSYGTPYLDDFISGASLGDSQLTGVLTTGQKKFSTKEDFPNLPKTKNNIYVYFSINKNLNAKVQDRQAWAKYLGSINSYLTDNDVNSKTVYGDNVISADAFSIWGRELSKFVKSATLPKIKFKTETLNEYNKKQIVYTNSSLEPFTIDFYSVKQNPVQIFFLNYLKIINNDFYYKSHNDWAKNNIPQNILTNEYDYMNSFGLSLDANFKLIDRICFIECYMNKVQVYTIESPTITNIDFGSYEIGSYDPQIIKITFDGIGMTNDLLDINPLINVSPKLLKNMIGVPIIEEVSYFANLFYRKATASSSSNIQKTEVNPLSFAKTPATFSQIINSGLKAVSENISKTVSDYTTFLGSSFKSNKLIPTYNKIPFNVG